MLYLSGMTQEETILVLIPGAKTKSEILFTSEADPRREHWNGHTLTPQEVTAESGVQTVYPLAAFQPFIDGLLGGTGYQADAGRSASVEFGAFFDAVKRARRGSAILERCRRAGAGGGGAARRRRHRPPAAGIARGVGHGDGGEVSRRHAVQCRVASSRRSVR